MKRKKELKRLDTKRTTSKPKPKRGIRPVRIFIYALALAALSGGGYLFYDYLRKKKARDASDDTADINTSTNDNNAASTTTKTTRAKANDNFPLKKGSKGPRVVQLQEALIKKGATLKADGKFGAATIAALKTAGYRDTVDETTFSSITGTQPVLQIIFNPADLAKKLYSAANGKNEQGVLAILEQIKTVNDYSAVNEYYKKQSFISKTIVTDLLEYAFKDDPTSQAVIKQQFKRIGLKVNNAGVWSLQGIQLYKDLITIRPTIVIDAANNRIAVKRNTILGDEVKIENGMTWFRSIDRNVLRVPTQDVKYSTN